MRILVVEDEQKVADALREGLAGEGYEVVVERTGEGAFSSKEFLTLRKADVTSNEWIENESACTLLSNFR
jgi:DNA-binding response OmpR family regulator